MFSVLGCKMNKWEKQLVDLESVRRVGSWNEMTASLGVSAVQGSEKLVGELVSWRTAVQSL
jgi:hypothetical protein